MSTLADRQQRLNIMLHKLNRSAEVHNIAVSLQTKSKVNQMISLQAGMVYVLQVGTLWVMLLHIEFSISCVSNKGIGRITYDSINKGQQAPRWSKRRQAIRYPVHC